MKPNPDTPPRTPPTPARSYRVMHAVIGPFMNILGLSCRHFSELCTARQDRSLTFPEKVRFRIHAIICSLCRPLTRQFDNLNHLARCAEPKTENEPDSAASPAALDPAARERIHDALVKEEGSGPDTEPR
ncbi:MAG: hypothetical protein ACC661_10260 [Verrucomicrobiales bacterium]